MVSGHFHSKDTYPPRKVTAHALLKDEQPILPDERRQMIRPNAATTAGQPIGASS
jgi:hypothetical protein